MKLETHKQNYLMLCQFMQNELSKHPRYEGCIFSERMLIVAQEQLRQGDEKLKLAVLDNILETTQECLYFIAEIPGLLDKAIRQCRGQDRHEDEEAGDTQQLEAQKYNCIKLCQFLQTQYGNPCYHEDFVYSKEIIIFAQVQLRKIDVRESIIAWGLLQTAMECIRLIAANLDQSKMQKKVAAPEKEAADA